MRRSSCETAAAFQWRSAAAAAVVVVLLTDVVLATYDPACLKFPTKSSSRADVFVAPQAGGYSATNKFLVVRDTNLPSGTTFTIDGANMPEKKEPDQWDAVIRNVHVATPGGSASVIVRNGARVLVEDCSFGTSPSNANVLTADVNGGSTLVIHRTQLGGNFRLICEGGSYCAFLRSTATAATGGQVLPSWRITTQALVLMQDSRILCPSGVCELTWASRMTTGAQVVFRKNVMRVAVSATHDTQTHGSTVAGYYNTFETGLRSTIFSPDICVGASSSTIRPPGSCPAAVECDASVICDTRFGGVTASIVAGDCVCDCTAAVVPAGMPFECQLRFDTDAIACGAVRVPTDTASSTASRSPTPTPSTTVSPPPTATLTFSATWSASRSGTPSPTRSAGTPSKSVSASRTATLSLSPPPTPSPTPSATASRSVSATRTVSDSLDESESRLTVSASPSADATASPSVSPSDVSASATPELPDLSAVKNAARNDGVTIKPNDGSDAATSAGAVASAAISPPTATKPTAMQRNTAAIGMCDSDEYVDDGFPSIFTFVPWVAVGTPREPQEHLTADEKKRAAQAALRSAVSNAAGAAMFTGGFSIASSAVVVAAAVARARGAAVPGISQPLTRLVAVTLVSFSSAFLFPSVMEACVFVATTDVADRTQFIAAIVGGSTMLLASYPLIVVSFAPKVRAAHDARTVNGVLAYLMDEIVSGSQQNHLMRYRLASFLDVFTALTVGVLAGLLRANANTHCPWAPAAMAIAAAALLVYYCALRPFADPLEQGVVLFVSLLQAVVSLMVFATLHWDRTLAPATERMSTAFEIIALLAPAVLAADALRKAIMERRKAKRAKLRAAKRAALRRRGEGSRTSSSSSLDSDAAAAFVDVPCAADFGMTTALDPLLAAAPPSTLKSNSVAAQAPPPPPPRSQPEDGEFYSTALFRGSRAGRSGRSNRAASRTLSRRRPLVVTERSPSERFEPTSNPLLAVPALQQSPPPTATPPTVSRQPAPVNERAVWAALEAVNAGHRPQQGGVAAV